MARRIFPIGSIVKSRYRTQRKQRRPMRCETLETRVVLSATGGLAAAPTIPGDSDGADSNSPGVYSIAHEANLPEQVFAPYVDATAWPPYDIVDLARTEGIRHVALSFIVADASTSEPSWGGYYSVESGYRGDQIDAIQSAGGEVLVSFGGAAGTPLAAAITDVGRLTEAYQSVIDQYDLRWIDFDVEGVWVTDTDSIDRRSEAIQQLQESAAADGKNLEVWFTLPVLPSGLTSQGLYVVESALRHGVVIGGVNIMAMNYGDFPAPNPENQMGEYAIQAAESLHDQLKSAYETANVSIDNTELWNLIGVTPMIGQNDVRSERFYLDDARELLAFAEERGLGLLSAWSANRDNPCDTFGELSLTCSGVPQEPNEFMRTLGVFTSASSSQPIDEGDETDGGGSEHDGEMGQADDSKSNDNSANVFVANPAGPDIVNFNVSTDRLDFAEISVHNLILGKLPTEEIAIVNPWAWTPEYQVIQDRTFVDLDIENYGVVANEHLRQDIGGIVSWEQGIGPREMDTVYVRSHEYGVQEIIEDFNANTDKLSFLYFGTRERLSVEDTDEGLLISVQPTNQSLLLKGITKSDLIPANLEFHHDQIVEDQLEVPFGFTVDQLTLVSRSDLLTPEAPAGEITDGHQTRPGSENNHHHDDHDHDGHHDHHDGTMPTISLANTSVNEPDEAAIEISFELALSAATSNDVVVDFETVSDTASSPSDFESVSGSLTIPAGETSGVIQVVVYGDQFEEENETFRLQLKNARNAMLQNNEAIGTIFDNDGVATAPEFSYRTTDDWGGGFNGEITITNRDDQPWSNWRLEFEWNREISEVWNGVLREQVQGKYVIENESWNGNVASGQSVTIGLGGNPGYVTDTPTDAFINGIAAEMQQARPAITIVGVQVPEGDTGQKLASVAVSLSDVSSDDVTVEYETIADTATAGSDYDANTGTLLIPAGTREAIIPVTIFGDTENESDEVLTVVLSNQVNATLANKAAEIVIQNDDSSVTSNTAEYRTVSDWGSGFTGELKLTNRSDRAWDGWQVEFEWERELPQFWNSTLVNRDGNQYSIENVGWNGRVEPGASVTVGFSGNPGDVTDEPRNIRMNGEAIGEDAADQSIVMTIDSASAIEPDDATATMAFRVKLSREVPEGQITSVDYQTISQTALSGEDYKPTEGTLTFLPGEIEKTIDVLINGDTRVEPDETFELALSGIVNATLGVDSAVGTIQNNDSADSNGSVQWSVSSSWATGYVASLKITNTGDKTWSDWQLDFDLSNSMDSLWGAEIISIIGERNSLGSLVWNRELAPGESLTIGYQVSGSAPIEPTNIELRPSLQ